MKKPTKILGLDLGVTSIGWALIESENDKPKDILGMGVRIIPLTTDESDEFSKGNAITKNRDRTTKRTQRKGLDRYQLRRSALIKCLKENSLMPDKALLLNVSTIELWGLRAKAARQEITLAELGRVLLHLNQKRGYKHSKNEGTEDAKKQTDYVNAVNSRYDYIQSKNITIGELFYKGFKDFDALQNEWDEVAGQPVFRTKEKVFPREAYIKEFDLIWETQKQKYPSILTDGLYNHIRNEIIYYQRKLKSQKGLVSLCEFSKKSYHTKEGKNVFSGPKVAPRSSPLFQVCKLWESINTITVKTKKNQDFVINLEDKQKIFNHLQQNEKLTQTDLFAILGIRKNEGYFANDQISKKGLQGNMTQVNIAKIIGSENENLNFNLEFEQVVNTYTGEITEMRQISASFEKEPLYMLWHIVYSLNNDENNCISTLKKVFGFDHETAVKLAALDFTKGGYGNKSARFIRKILPYLMEGKDFSKACQEIGYNHSNSLTKEEEENRELAIKLELLKKGSLRQPVVEKILNQMINLVNAITNKYSTIDEETGKPEPFEIRVELARELKQSKEERNNAYKNINDRERENNKIREMLLEHPEFRKKAVSKRDIDRYRLWMEFDRVSPYEPSKIIGIGELFGGGYDIEHIVPKSLRFDDSFSNKTICLREFNSSRDGGKNNKTAFDYMSSSKSEAEFETYITFIQDAYKEKKISKTKYENLLVSAEKLKEGFIDRQLRETQYISRKAKELLSTISHDVHATSGGITQRLRQLWGWEEVLEIINLPKYKSLGLTEEIEINHNGNTSIKERIKGWSKRDDHRHHAIDALTVACTKQSYIQRLNTLNSQQTRDEIFEEIGKREDKKFSLLDQYLISLKPFDTNVIVKEASEILISFKPGKKVSTYSQRIGKKDGKKQPLQTHIIEPRGPLSEESVYGKIKRKVKKTIKLDKNFTQFNDVVDLNIKRLLNDRLVKYGNDPQKAFGNLKKEPLWLDQNHTEDITSVEIYELTEEFVIKYPLSNIGPKDLDFIVDKAVRGAIEARLAAYDNKPKDAFKDLINNPVWLNEEKRIPIKSVRCYTGIKHDSVVPIVVKDASWDIEYKKYVKPGNNHHIAIYKDEYGKLIEHAVTFWHAVERKRYGLPVIIKNPADTWDLILNRELRQEFLAQIPGDKWVYQTSMQQNESFVFNMSMDELTNAIENKKFDTISPNVFRLRKITKGNYWFNQQYETTPRESLEDKKAKRTVQAALSTMNGIKIKINNIGEIFLGES